MCLETWTLKVLKNHCFAELEKLLLKKKVLTFELQGRRDGDAVQMERDTATSSRHEVRVCVEKSCTSQIFTGYLKESLKFSVDIAYSNFIFRHGITNMTYFTLFF